jgi:Domain of unknown function (DUF397)
MPLSRDWAKSSYSDPNGGNCVQARQARDGIVQVRDSKNPDGAVLTFSADCWRDFIATVKINRPGK